VISWSALFARRFVHEDADILVVDKPWGLATHAPERTRHDDLVSLLRVCLAARGESDYLGIHQRLDRDTTGALLFARRKDANKALAAELEGRRAKKTYVAVVEGKVPDRAELRHFLRPGDEGLTVARPARGSELRGEALAVTHLVALERRSGRALVELRPETGRTHQIRAQLAAVGAPIVGDVEYGGPPFIRPLLHASRLALRHPGSGEPRSFEAPVPDDLALGLARRDPTLPGDEEGATRAFGEAALRRFGIFEAGRTTAVRLAHGEGDGLPGVSVDLYGEHAVLSAYEPLDDDRLRALGRGLVAIGIRGVYVKHRPKDASRLPDTRRDDVAPRAPIAGEAAPASFEVLEAGVPFEVKLADGLSTGLFLDQRDNRARVRELSRGARVLNLFAYTGSFSVVAALGGAASTTTVDVSRTALAWAEQNFGLAGAAPGAMVESDVIAFLERAQKRGEEWDIAVLDPPSFSRTKRTTFSAESDYPQLAARVLRVLAPGGRLLACTNHHAIGTSRFRKMLHEACRIAGKPSAQLKSFAPPRDFPPAPGREPHMKSALVVLGRDGRA
jgi:23S rRNA (cytosine1962-C5)-methyltransferase